MNGSYSYNVIQCDGWSHGWWKGGQEILTEEEDLPLWHCLMDWIKEESIEVSLFWLDVQTPASLYSAGYQWLHTQVVTQDQLSLKL